MSQRIRPAELTLFLAIADHRNFRRAALELGVTASALSHALRGLEERLGLRLFNRTTRSVALTEAGERLADRLRPAFRSIDEALEALDEFRGSPLGNLRINCARVSARMQLLPMLSPFLALHPGITAEIIVDDSLGDIVGQGCDAGIRFGETIAADMIAVPLGTTQRTAIVAAPGLLERWPIPRRPEDLRGLPCVRLRFSSGRYYDWEFEKDGRAVSIAVDGPLAVNDQDLTIEAALAGTGFTFAFEQQVEADIAAGRLVRVLEDWCPPYPGVYLYYPSRRQMPAPLRAFIDFVKLHSTLA